MESNNNSTSITLTSEPAAEWVVMVMDRIAALEGLVDRQDKLLKEQGKQLEQHGKQISVAVETLNEHVETLNEQIDSLKHRTADVETVALEYKVATNRFNTGDELDWFVWEPVEMAQPWASVIDRPLDHFQYVQVKYPASLPPTFTIHMPVHAESGATRSVESQGSPFIFQCVQELLTEVHDFYSTRITLEDIVDLPNDAAGYVARARSMLQRGEHVTWAHLLGKPEYEANLLYSTCSDSERRDPFDCVGRVRFGGMTLQPDGSYLVRLMARGERSPYDDDA